MYSGVMAPKMTRAKNITLPWWQHTRVAVAIFRRDLKIFGSKFFQPMIDFSPDFLQTHSECSEKVYASPKWHVG